MAVSPDPSMTSIPLVSEGTADAVGIMTFGFDAGSGGKSRIMVGVARGRPRIRSASRGRKTCDLPADGIEPDPAADAAAMWRAIRRRCPKVSVRSRRGWQERRLSGHSLACRPVSGAGRHLRGLAEQRGFPLSERGGFRPERSRTGPGRNSGVWRRGVVRTAAASGLAG